MLRLIGTSSCLALAALGLVACDVSNSNSAGNGIRDADGDGFREDEDCDDRNGDVYPGADELCNEIDDDCDEEIDEDAVDALPYYTDADEDGYGDPASSLLSCVAVEGAVLDGGDCLDTDPSVNPAGTEVCNDGLDNDCDGGFNDCSLEEDIDLAGASVRLLGEEAGDMAGRSLASLDLNGDLVNDLVVGAPGYDGDGGSTTGAAYVLLGPISGTIGLSAADAVWEGVTAGDQAGFSVSSAGDINNDNLPDVLVGSPSATYEGAEVGVAYLLLGPGTAGGSLDEADAILHATASGDNGGYAVSGLGDLSGDGVDDIAVSAMYAQSGAGRIYLLQGPLEGEIALTAANAILAGPAGSLAGTSLAAAGDLNGDGTPDLIVGAVGLKDGSTAVGGAYILHGPVVGNVTLSDVADGRVLGVTLADYVGYDVAGVGDLDGDGLDDVLIGAPADDTNGVDAGAAFLFHGPVTGSQLTSAAAARLVGQHEESTAGLTVAGGIDLDQDGSPDLIVGAPGSNYEPDGGSGRNGSGAAYAVYGPVSGLVALSAADVLMGGAATKASAGWAVGASSDLTGDSVPDILVGAPAISDSSSAGSVYIVEGQGL